MFFCRFGNKLNSYTQKERSNKGQKVTMGSEPKMDISSISIERPVYTLKDFDQVYNKVCKDDESLLKTTKDKLLSCCSFSPECVKDKLIKKFPIIPAMKNYNIKENIFGDIVAGLTVGVMHTPMGLAFGLLTLLPPVYGLYASFWPVLLYLIFGTCHHLSFGTMAIMSLMMSSVVERAAQGYKLSMLPGGVSGNQTMLPPGGDIISVTQSIGGQMYNASSPLEDDPELIAVKVII